MKVSGFILFLLLSVASVCYAQKQNARYYFKQGEAALEENKYTMALAHFNECLRLDPYFWQAYQLRGSAKQGLGDKKGALTDYNIYIDSGPKDPEAILSRGTLRYELGQYQLAKEDFTKLLLLPPIETTKIIFRQDLGGTDKMYTLQGSNHADFLNYLGLISIKLKEYPKGLIFLDSAIALMPQDPQYFLNRGILKEHLLDTTAALADYDQALKLDPTFGLALHNIAVIKRSRGQQQESENLLDQAILQNPSISASYSARGFFRLTHQNLKGALEDYDKALQLNRSDEEAWLYRGIVHDKLKNYDQAFVDYTESISLKNDFARAWLARGTLLTKLNRLPEAIEDYSVAILWSPEYGLAFYNRGIARQKSGKLKEACQDLIAAENFHTKVDAALKEKVCK